MKDCEGDVVNNPAFGELVSGRMLGEDRVVVGTFEGQSGRIPEALVVENFGGVGVRVARDSIAKATPRQRMWFHVRGFLRELRGALAREA